MNTYINQLPIELQERLLDEIQSYGQITKNKIAGQYYFNNIVCYKDITINEFLNYLETQQPDKAFVYIQGYKQYIILEIITKFGHYYTTAHIVDYKYQIIVVSKQHVSFHQYLNMPHTTISFDLVSTVNIYLKRKGCHHLQNYLLQQYDNHFYSIQDDIFIDLVNKLKMIYYIISNKSITTNQDERLTVITLFLQKSLYHIHFEDFIYEGDQEDLDYINDYFDGIMVNNQFFINYINSL